jgi:hypothetical protein
MHWKGDPRRVMCGQPENADHIMFSCLLARFTWECPRQAMEWSRVPKSYQYFLDNWLHIDDGGYGLKLFILAIVLWSLWTTRNKDDN